MKNFYDKMAVARKEETKWEVVQKYQYGSQKQGNRKLPNLATNYIPYAITALFNLHGGRVVNK